MIHSQASEHLVAVINPCDPEALTLSWKQQTAGPGLTIQQPTLFTVLLLFLRWLSSGPLQPSVILLSFFFRLGQFAQHFPLPLLVPQCPHDQCFTNGDFLGSWFRFWISRSGWGLRLCIPNKLPGVAAAAGGVWATLLVARI